MIPEDTAQRIAELFEAALREQPANRAAFLAQACGPDRRVWDEVTSLVTEYERRGETEPRQPLSTAAGMIGRYEVRRELGRGGMGIVYEGFDTLLRRRIALKVIRLDGPGLPPEPDKLRGRLLREARTAASLLHPNIVNIYDSGAHGDLAYIAMELVDGATLAHRIAAGPLERNEALAILRQAAEALDYSHVQGVVHRDVKPSNILLRGRTVKITDFGIAKVTGGEQSTRSALAAGTPSYMSPEQIRNQPVDGRADQFSLAVAAYEMLNGVKPFEAQAEYDLMRQIVEGERPRSPVFARALAKRSEDRFADCGEFVRELGRSLRPAKASRAVPRAMAAGAVLLLLAVAWVIARGVMPRRAPPALDTRHVVLNQDFERLGLRSEAFFDDRPANPDRNVDAKGDRAVPSQVRGISDVVAVSGGWGHTLIAKSDGSVWNWGWDADAQLGDGGRVDRSIAFRPVVPALVRFRSVAAGPGSLALAEGGSAWIWGRRRNPHKVAGLPVIMDVRAGAQQYLALAQDGSVWSWSEIKEEPVMIAGLRGIAAVSCGEWFGLALDRDGTVWSWGRNISGRLGDGTNIDRATPVRVMGLSGVKAIAAGTRHGVALKGDGTVWGWGENSYGELGDGTGADSWRPVKAYGLEGVTAIAAGSQHTLALKPDGTIWGWGQNAYGSLGDGTFVDRHRPVRTLGISGVVAIASGGQHTLARKYDGTLWTWGWNDYGQLGRPAVQEMEGGGAATMTINYQQNSGPLYSMIQSGFPWILIDRGAHRILLRPGKGSTYHWGAAVGYDVTADGEYVINGSFQRVNNFPATGGGVDTAVFLDADEAHPLWAKHIDSSELSPEPFSVRARLRRGQVVRFALFNIPRGLDRNIDETALKATIDRQ